LAEYLAAALVLQVEHDTSLVRVHPEVHRSLAAHRAIPVTHHVAARWLDLDDLRAEVGQVAHPQRTADRHPQRDDADAVEWKRHVIPPERRVPDKARTTGRASLPDTRTWHATTAH